MTLCSLWSQSPDSRVRLRPLEVDAPSAPQPAKIMDPRSVLQSNMQSNIEVNPEYSSETPLSPNQLDQKEARRREQILSRATQALYDADRLKTGGDLKAAAVRYQFVVSVLPSTGPVMVSSLHDKAATSLADIRAKMGDIAYSAKNYSAAAQFYQQATHLAPHDKNYREKLERARRKEKEAFLQDPNAIPDNREEVFALPAQSPRATRVTTIEDPEEFAY